MRFDVLHHRYQNPEKHYAALAWLREKREARERENERRYQEQIRLAKGILFLQSGASSLPWPTLSTVSTRYRHASIWTEGPWSLGRLFCGANNVPADCQVAGAKSSQSQ